MTYYVDQIETPDGVFFTARNDTRTSDQIVQDGITGFESGINSKIYASLNEHQDAKIVHRMEVPEGKDRANSIKKSLIEWAESQGKFVLNEKK